MLPITARDSLSWSVLIRLSCFSFALSMAEEIRRRTGSHHLSCAYAWGFTTEERRVPSQAEIDALLPAVDYQQITISEGQLRVPQGAAIDLGAVAKGYIGDGVTAS